MQSQSKKQAEAKLKSLLTNFLAFKNYPLNQFTTKIHRNISGKIKDNNFKAYYLTPQEIASIFYFPKDPKTETALLTVKSKKLSVPVGTPTFDYSVDKNNEILTKNYPQDCNIL